MLIELHKVEETFALTDHAVRDADNVAQFDVVIGRSLARASVCRFSGDIKFEHFADGVETLRCKRFKLNCLTVTRQQLQEVLAVLLQCSLRHGEEDDRP